MLETAEKLSKLKDKLIVITGAMRPEKFSNSDASFNVGMAVGGMSVLSNGVYIAMHGKIMSWEKCTRDLESGKFIDK